MTYDPARFPRAATRRHVRSARRYLGTALALAGFAFVAVATLTPASDVHGLALTTPLLCLVCGEHGGADVAANLLLFLPLAIGLRLAGASWGQTVLTCGALSFAVELLQLRVIPGRDASLSDLLANTTSGAIGGALGTWLPRLVAPRPAPALALLAGGGTAFVLLLAAWAWLLGPWLPDGELMSRWAHEAPGADVFEGRVRSVRLDGVPMPRNGPPPDSAAFRRRLEGGAFSLEADLTSGAPVRDRVWVYMVRVPSGGGLTVNQLGRQAGLAVPSRALRFGLRPPMLTLGQAFPETAGEPVRIVATESSRRLRLASSHGGVERSVELGISPAFGWSMFLPLDLAEGGGVRWITGLLLAAMLIPLGHWAASTGRPRPAAGALALALVAGLAVLPAATGLPPVHWSEWLAGVLGAAAGWALQPLAAYLQGRCASPSDSEFSSS